MKKEGHPVYYKDAKVICVCGNTFTTGSTMKEVKTDICSACHPFYTGKQKLMDVEGRIDKFNKRYAKTAAKK
jgi:large subunit ribosomal protein L31